MSTAGEFAAGHLNNGMNLNFKDTGFQEQLAKLDKTKPYLVYCAVGGRGRKTTSLRQEMKFLQVYKITGGFPELHKFGIPLSL